MTGGVGLGEGGKSAARTARQLHLLSFAPLSPHQKAVGQHHQKGVAVAAKETRAPSEARPERFYATRPYFAEYARTPGDPEPILPRGDGSGSVWARYSRYGKLDVINSGIAGRGFRVCSECGWAEPIDPGAKQSNARHHNNPRTGRECRARVDGSGVHLGHEFITDTLEIQFHGALGADRSQEHWLSVLYALLEGASEALGIPREDLNGALYPCPRSPSPALILFDDVPGGAALVRQIMNEAELVFQAALARVSRCECGEETSCYQCLRNYYNQFCHSHLRRGLARDLLEQALQRV